MALCPLCACLCMYALTFISNIFSESTHWILTKLFKNCCYGRPLYQAWLLPDLKQYLTTALWRILFSSVFMVLALGAQGHWFESYPDFIFLPCIYSFVSLLWTLFIRLSIALFRNSSKNLICINSLPNDKI